MGLAVSVGSLFKAVRYLLLGFGVMNLIFGGIVLCSKASTALIRLVMPEAPSEWPTFGFTCYISNCIDA